MRSRSQKDNKLPYFSGGTTNDDQARIHNYVHKHVLCGKKLDPSNVLLSLAHARTLLVAHRYHTVFLQKDGCPDPSQEPEKVALFTIEKAWEHLQEYNGLSLDGTVTIKSADVDLEAIKHLDHAMFDMSENAGVGGNSQWGLDIGMHEDNWSPYDNDAPEMGIGADHREGSDSVR